MKDKLVTLIGGGGFIGRYAVQALLKAGARVRVAQRDPRSAWFLKSLGGLGQTQVVAADLANPASIAHALIGSDAVVNLTGVLAGDFQLMHVDGPASLARAAAEAGATAFVHMSAIGADPQSASQYGRSKGLGEAAVRAVFPQATILRPSVVFGQEDAFVNRFAGMIAKVPIVPVLRPTVKFQPVFVGDVAEAVAASLTRGDARGATYELGGPDVLTMAELQRWIAQAIGRSPSFVELPDAAGAAIAGLGFLPGAPITKDQWLMLQRDNIVAPGAHGLADLGLSATPLAAVAPAWLVRYRRHGRFGGKVVA